jgi:hypothetical protein
MASPSAGCKMLSLWLTAAFLTRRLSPSWSNVRAKTSLCLSPTWQPWWPPPSRSCGGLKKSTPTNRATTTYIWRAMCSTSKSSTRTEYASCASTTWNWYAPTTDSTSPTWTSAEWACCAAWDWPRRWKSSSAASSSRCRPALSPGMTWSCCRVTSPCA